MDSFNILLNLYLALKQKALPDAQEWGWAEHVHVFQIDSSLVMVIFPLPPILSLIQLLTLGSCTVQNLLAPVQLFLLNELSNNFFYSNISIKVFPSVFYLSEIHSNLLTADVSLLPFSEALWIYSLSYFFTETPQIFETQENLIKFLILISGSRSPVRIFKCYFIKKTIHLFKVNTKEIFPYKCMHVYMYKYIKKSCFLFYSIYMDRQR